jgi:chromosome segregation ATPase
MEGDLSEAQKREQMRAAAFAELRAAKMQEISSGEKMAEEKEDQLATQDNQLAEAKEDLVQEQASLSADQKFMKNLKETCANADTNYRERTNARLTEIKAISETIEILQGDEARDAMSGTFNFLQVGASQRESQSSHRRQAADRLRLAARRSQDPMLSVLATSVELDAFTKVKKAIDDMIAMLKQQQEDEVKKTDWCKSELQSNEMATKNKESEQADLEAKIAKLESEIKALEAGIADAKSEIAKVQLDLQTASKSRKQENMDFQKTIADQTVTIEVLHKALDRLATYYDLVQTKGNSWIQRQTPDVVQAEYKKSKGAGGVMEMIEKLIHDSRELMADSKKSESEAQAAYEQLIADTNASVEALQKEIVSKTKAKVDAEKDKRQTESDLSDTLKELDGLAKYNGELHVECDYVLKNFEVRQNGRQEEIEALQQAKQILNGATLA